jgi:pimeloyl-ACP methyl ester carboxylesterase
VPAAWCNAGVEVAVDGGDVALPGTLDRPDGPVRGAVVALHGSEAGQRSYFLYEHLARLLPPTGIAVLRYDRRPAPHGGDVPLAVQAADARAAMALLRRQIGAEAGGLPVGLWGFSQGAWAALAAADAYPLEVAFLVGIGMSGVSPARQMRFGTAEQLRRHGYDRTAVAELAGLRATVEEYLRGRSPRAPAQAEVDRLAGRAWFPLAYLPRRLPDRPGSWSDMDFDPAPAFARLRCPVLLFYGETDEWVPIDESIAVWRRAAAASIPRICRLPGCGHLPTRGGVADRAAISPRYADALLGWLDARLPAG